MRRDLLFGMPIYRTKADPKSYNKKEITDVFYSNYQVENYRDKWDESFVSNFHHSKNSECDDKFIMPNYTNVIPIYQQKTEEFLQNLKVDTDAIKFTFRIVNYTVCGESQHMKSHVHGSDFSAVHFIQFDKKTHTPVTYDNTHIYAKYLQQLNPNLKKLLDKMDGDNSWLWGDFTPTHIEEDDIVFSPSVFSHHIKPQKYNGTLRMTIAFNINLYDKNQEPTEPNT